MGLLITSLGLNNRTPEKHPRASGSLAIGKSEGFAGCVFFFFFSLLLMHSWAMGVGINGGRDEPEFKF